MCQQVKQILALTPARSSAWPSVLTQKHPQALVRLGRALVTIKFLLDIDSVLWYYCSGRRVSHKGPPRPVRGVMSAIVVALSVCRLPKSFERSPPRIAGLAVAFGMAKRAGEPDLLPTRRPLSRYRR